MRFFFIAVMFFISAFTLWAQDTIQPKVYPLFEYSVFGGKVIKHREAMSVMGDEPYLGQDLKLVFQTTGHAYWHKKYKYPAYGLGLYSGYFNNPIIGNPFATYGFMELPFKRGENYSLSTSWATGLSFHINEYDSINNPQNVAIGTDLNVYIEFNLAYKRMVTDRLNIGAGIKFQHFSNGAIRFPNLGLNMLTGQLIFGFLPKKRTPFMRKSITAPNYKKYEITGFYGMGWRGQNQLDSDVRYANSVFSLSLSKRINFKRAFGGGVDVSFYPYTEEKLDDDQVAKTNDFMAYSGYVSTDLIAGDFRMVVQLGTYFYRAIKFSKPVYERVAIRYYFMNHAFVNVSIKAHYAKAQCVEWGVGFTL